MPIPAAFRERAGQATACRCRPRISPSTCSRTTSTAREDRRCARRQDRSICPYLDARRAAGRDAAGWRGFGERLAAVGDTRARTPATASPGTTMTSSSRRLPTARCRRSIMLDGGARHRLGDGRRLDRARRRRPARLDRQARQAHHRRPRQGHRPAGRRHGRGRLGRCRPRHARLGEALCRRCAPRRRRKYFVIEHDNPNDFERFARRSIEAVSKY